MGSQSFSGPSYLHPAVKAGRVRWWIVTVVTFVASIPVNTLAGMLCFSWLVGIGPRLEASSTWALKVTTWFIAIVTDASYAMVSWISLPAGIVVVLAVSLWAMVVAPRIISSPSVMAYTSQRDHHTGSETLTRWMRNPDPNIQARARNIYTGKLMIELITQLIKSAAAGLFTAGLIIGVTAVVNATDSGLWGGVAFIVAVIVALLIYIFIFEFIPQAQIEAAAQLERQQELKKRTYPPQ